MFLQSVGSYFYSLVEPIIFYFNLGSLPLDDFERACKVVALKRSDGSLSDQDFYILFGLFKQATVGNYNVTDESDGDTVQLLKWSSWKNCNGKSRKESMLEYISITNSLFGDFTPDEGSMGFGVLSQVNLLDNLDKNFPHNEFFSQVTSGNLEAIKEILKDDPNMVNVTTPEGLTPLHLAADRGFDHIVKLLIKYGADINAVDDNGDTALHVAIESEQQEIIKILIDNNANTELGNIDGLTQSEMLNSRMPS
ncbi:ankyrin repeat domain containing protein [Theileria equi strain WA]|uniref:Ankyrin repeat domain containing protein n=1 Tax=Theileria equi strain WA TaxID=1537102 RepID=L1LEE6_THEEQ|nr:ankyrin repeat domain containing protein [Theileria equi strain WA]EKX73782.1 ankyrin repeat domain containing protein [Theileria equi strain WA]|eukprot:XP_004833234.1 ankyrin repeat domain containing protein [Theileria equi strain WA]